MKLLACERSNEKHSRLAAKALSDLDKVRAEGELRARECESAFRAASASELASLREVLSQEIKSAKSQNASLESRVEVGILLVLWQYDNLPRLNKLCFRC